LKTVKWLTLKWVDAEDHEWGVGAAIMPVQDDERAQDMAIKRLTEVFDEWRRGDV
jgi:hypothetical protein